VIVMVQVPRLLAGPATRTGSCFAMGSSSHVGRVV